MTRWKNLLSLILLTPILLLSSGCGGWKSVLPVEIKTVEVERKIPVQNRPRSIKLNSIYFYVVTENNFKEFKDKFVKENGEFVGYVLSVRNMAEIKRYLQQQKEIIVYYEKAVIPLEIKKENNK